MRSILVAVALVCCCEAKPVDPKSPLFKKGDAVETVADSTSDSQLFDPGSSGMKSTAAFHSHGQHSAHASFSEADRDKNGFVSLSEVLLVAWRDRAVALSKFRAADKNNDGILKDLELHEIEGKDEENKDRNFVEFMSVYFKNDLHHKHPMPTDMINLEDYQRAVKAVWEHERGVEFAKHKNANNELNEEQFTKLHTAWQQKAKMKLYEEYKAFSTKHPEEEDKLTSDEWFDMVWEKRFNTVKLRALEFFTECDQDQDGIMTMEEYKSHGDAKEHTDAKYEAQFYEWVPADQDDRTRVTLKQVLEAVDKQFGNHALSTFKAADKNHDGFVDKSEMTIVKDHGFHLEL